MEIIEGTHVRVEMPYINPVREEIGVVTAVYVKCEGFMFLADGYDTPCFVKFSQILEVL